MDRRAVFTHNDLDGLVCAVLARVAMPDADVYFCEYSALADLVRRRLGRYDVIWLTDLSIRDTDLFGAMREADVDCYWFDHHDSSLPQAWMVECRIDTTGDACAADVVRQYLDEQGIELPVPWQTLCDYAHDQDLWIRKLPEAQRFNDILGHMHVQELFDLLTADPQRVYDWTESMRAASEATAAERERSLALAQATSVRRPLADGREVLAACCWGSTSEVGDALGDGDTLVVLFDLRTAERGQPKFSFRTQSDTIASNRIAEQLGGGGHPKASGAPMPVDALHALSEELIERVVAAWGRVEGDGA